MKNIKHEKNHSRLSLKRNKKTDKEPKNINWNSSDDNDLIGIDSSTDSKRNLNTENQSETEDANDSINVSIDTSENEAKKPEQGSPKSRRRQAKLTENSRLIIPKYPLGQGNFKNIWQKNFCHTRFWR